MKHTRWFCHECKRQWLYAKDWGEGSNCPACGGQYVEKVEYDAFPGGDYGGPAVPFVYPDQRPVVDPQAPSLALTEEKPVDYWQWI